MTTKPNTQNLRLCLSLLAAGISTGAPAEELLFTLAPDSDHLELGSAFAAAGDLDADGVPDVAIADRSARVNSLLGSGIVHLVSGTDGSILRSLTGEPAASQGFGSAIVSLDADHDNIPDLAIGAPGHASGSVFGAGAVRIFSGADGSLLGTCTGSAGSQLGVSLARAGDQNGDGIDDLYAGAPNANGRGAVWVISGADCSVIREIQGSSPASSFGLSVEALGDIDGDGKADLAVSSPAYRDAVYQEGRIEIIRSTDGTTAAQVKGAQVYQRLGDSLAPAPDMNGDGLPDLLVGSYSGGAARVVSGSDLTTIKDLSVSGLPPYQNVTVGGALDFNRDGNMDFLLGSSGLTASGNQRLGGIRITSGADGAPLFQLDAAAPFTGLGISLRVLPGIGFAAGETYLIDPDTRGMGLARVWKVEQTPPVTDRDGDGVTDDLDKEIDSIMDATVVILGQDSRVPNRVDAEGVTLADRFAALGEASSVRVPALYFVKAVHLTNKMVRMKLVNHREASQLKAAALMGVKTITKRKRR